MKIAILYICTGKYNCFFNDFYSSAELFFLKDIANIEYFVFTDNMALSKEDNVHLIYKECSGFPADSLFRFEMFLQVKDELLKFDYIYFFNANTEFKQKIGIEILPQSGIGLVMAEWPGKRKPFKHPAFYPYERNKKSLAYIAPFEKKPYVYFMGGINGGSSRDFLTMIDTLADNIREDYKLGIVARVHDESHINKYMRTHECKILPPDYCWPEEWNANFKPKIVFRDKVKLNSYFNKGRDFSLIGKLKKSIDVIIYALRWYFA